MKVIVFDLGGTLMQYVGMPLSWVDFYLQGFKAIKQKYRCRVSESVMEESVALLKGFNPRINYREVEYSPEYIFDQVLEKWSINAPMEDMLHTFWQGLELKAEIYPDTIPVLKMLKEKGYVIATLTDLPNAMPDALFKKDIGKILDSIDYYVSSAVCGYRKPNTKGLKMISERYNTSLNELIFVGDEGKDRQTALNAECKFIYVNRANKENSGISNLYELLDIVGQEAKQFC